MRYIVVLEAVKEVVVEADSPEEAVENAKDELLCVSDWDDIYAQDGLVHNLDTKTSEQVDICV